MPGGRRGDRGTAERPVAAFDPFEDCTDDAELRRVAVRQVWEVVERFVR